MEIMVWSERLATGIEEIDNQHKRIVTLVNQLHKIKQSGNFVAIGEVIEEMVDYALSHFAFEEEIMEAANYRFRGAHKRVHDLFVRKIPEFQKRFAAGENISDELHRMLVRWLYNHISNEDQGYVKSIKEYLRAQDSTEANTSGIVNLVPDELPQKPAPVKTRWNWLKWFFGGA
jgi:hemerythrin